MIELMLTIFCLIVSFMFGSKMKVKSIAQAVLAVIMAFIVFFLMPNAPLSHLIEPYTLCIVQEVLTEISASGISITNIILYAVFFLTILSIFGIVEYVKERFDKKESITKKVEERKTFIREEETFFENKIYLLFCRLLN